MLKIIIIGTIAIISFIAGAVWLQIKETKMGIKAKFNCNNCKATGCQAKWCFEKRRQYKKELIKEKEIKKIC